MVVFGVYLGGFVEEVCFLFFYMFLGVVKKEGGPRSRITFYVSTF
jgi:hypothetical protein